MRFDMAISADLGEVLEKVVADLVENGRYNSKSEVLREGMRLVRSVRHGCGNWMRSWRKDRPILMRGASAMPRTFLTSCWRVTPTSPGRPPNEGRLVRKSHARPDKHRRFHRARQPQSKSLVHPGIAGYEHKGYRRRPLGNYLIIYTVGEQAGTVVRVLHAAQNLARPLENGPEN
jgi:Arc/MetJ-type ribon-helix-helix transcriptional regulator/plasmid stabilization system protein ParE